jgi:hypothetical protein
MEKGDQIKKSSLEYTDWKHKSIKRGKEAKALNKRIRELIVSRDLWKSKYTDSKAQCIIWEVELIKIKKKLNDILSQ